MLYKTEFVIAAKDEPEWFLTEEDYWTSHLDRARIYDEYEQAKKHTDSCGIIDELIIIQVDTTLSIHEED